MKSLSLLRWIVLIALLPAADNCSVLAQDNDRENPSLIENGLRDDVVSAAEQQLVVEIATTQGAFRLELAADRAPATVRNFVEYVKTGHYTGTVFHRVIADFVVQGGGLTEDLRAKPTAAPVANESNNGLSNRKYSIAMARTAEPHSATCQFFINLRDNPSLDYDPATKQPGYTVFGSVTAGQEVLEKIARVPTQSQMDPLHVGVVMNDVPNAPIIILSTTLVNGQP